MFLARAPTATGGKVTLQGVILGQFDGPGNAARRAAFPSTFPAMTREVPGIHVTPAKAGVQFFLLRVPRDWIPACAGMTKSRGCPAQGRA
jgi:hypothetical protein